jgi:hypothetical protein
MEYLRKKYLKETMKSMRENNLPREDYGILRELYSERFSGMSSEKLLDKYMVMLERIENLEKRYEKVKLLGHDKLFLKFTQKGKKLCKVLNNIEEETERRKRGFNDLINEIEKERGISIESVFTNGMFLN